MTKKIIKNASIVLLGIAAVLIIWLLLAIGRFKYNEATTDFNEALNDKKTLLIIYKPGCKRCRETLPRLYLKNVFALKRENIVNQDKLSKKDKNKVENGLTPKFFYNGREYETKDNAQIEKIWRYSH